MTPTPEHHPVVWNNPIFAKLHNLLVIAYRDQATAYAFLGNVPMVEGTIPVNPRTMRVFWQEVINTAHEQERLMDLINAAIADPERSAYHPGLRDCRDLYQEYLSHSSAVGEVTPVHPDPLLADKSDGYSQPICGIEFRALSEDVQEQLLRFAATRKAYEQQPNDTGQ